MRGLGARRRSYRRGQSAVLFALAVLVVIACATGPWYERAVEQATVRSTLSGADRTTRSLSISVATGTATGQVAPSGPAARLFGPPIAGTDVFATFTRGRYGKLATTVTYRDRQCAHLSLVSGHCPANSGDVLASSSLAHKVGLRLGQRLTVVVPDPSAIEPFNLKMRIIGFYRPFSADNDYWFGTHYSSRAGVVVSSDAVQADAFFGSDFFVSSTAAKQSADATSRSYVNVALHPDRVGVDDLGALRRTVEQPPIGADSSTVVTTGLGDLLDRIDAGRSDARRIVLAISSQLALLAVIAFGVVVAAAADQRRPELALARLRGRSPVRSAGVFLREVGGLALLALVPGVLAAWGLVAAACHFWLVPGVRPEWHWPVAAAVAGAAVIPLLVAAAIGLRVSRQPITDLLRQVPKRVARAGVSTAEAAVGVAAAAGLLASLGNGKDNALATLTPTFIAVLVGLLASRLVAVGARVAGRRALWRGRVARGLGNLAIARRSGARFTITVLCVATAVIVFAGQQWSVAGSNREARAAATVGAPVVLDVSAPSGSTLLDAVHDADPSGDYASPVVVVTPPGIKATPTVAIDPGSFRRVASWGRSSLRPAAATLQRLRPAKPAPTIAFRATKMQLTLTDIRTDVISHDPADPKPRVQVGIDYVRANGQPGLVDLGPLPAQSSRPVTLGGSVECSRGCRVSGIQIDRSVRDVDPIELHFTVAALRAGTGLRIGTAGQWASVTDPVALPTGSEHTRMSAANTPTGLQFTAIDDGDNAQMQYLDLPVALPALLAGPRPDNVDSLGYLLTTGLDADVARVAVKGRIPFVPQVGGAAVVTDLDLSVRVSSYLDPTAHPSIWLGRDDPAREKRLIASLRRHDVVVVTRTTEAHALAQLTHSAPGWSAQLTLAAAVLSELLAIALLVLVVLTSRRSRQQDLAAMRLLGVPQRRLRRASLLELLTFVVVGVAGGAVAGIVAVRLSLPSIPIFSAPPTVPLSTVFPPEWAWLAGTIVISGVLLIGATVSLSRSLVRRATAQRLAGEAL